MKKALLYILSFTLGIISTVIFIKVKYSKIKPEVNDKIDKYKSYYNILNQWLILKNKGVSIENYFIKNNYSIIAIYGMGELGNRLYDELKDSSVKVLYAIDKSAESVYTNLELYALEPGLKKVDVIIVSAVFDYDRIENELRNLVDYPIVSLEDVVYDL